MSVPLLLLCDVSAVTMRCLLLLMCVLATRFCVSTTAVCVCCVPAVPVWCLCFVPFVFGVPLLFLPRRFFCYSRAVQPYHAHVNCVSVRLLLLLCISVPDAACRLMCGGLMCSSIDNVLPPRLWYGDVECTFGVALRANTRKIVCKHFWPFLRSNEKTSDVHPTQILQCWETTLNKMT